jgi:hypothetical protein
MPLRIGSPADLVALFRRWERDGLPPLERLAELTFDHLGIDGASPLALACRAIAADAEQWCGHPYHGRSHHAEVASAAAFLAGRAPSDGWEIAPSSAAELVCAAFGHDVLFDPSASPRVPYALEAAAAGRAAGIAAAKGAPAVSVERIHALIVATEPSARSSLRDMLGGSCSSVPPELAPLARDRSLLRAAAILSDADLVGSSGLGVEWADVQDARYERETGVPASPASKAAFLEHLVGNYLSAPARALEPGKARLQRHLAAKLSPVPVYA